MRITVKRMTLERFKGIERFELSLAGESASIYGENATGKTTLKDGFFWCLFGKDSAGRVDFPIKTMGADGEPLHGLDHSVEVVLSVDGHELTLKRTYRELWQKTRGRAEAAFQGHETQFLIDGVPTTKRDYEARITSIVAENVFALLADPAHFNTLHWQRRREILLSVTGDVTDADVIASTRTLADLPGILNGRKMDDHRKVIAARRKEINQELERIPVRIDEATRALPEDAGADRAALLSGLAEQRWQRQKFEEERIRIQAGGQVAEKRRRIAEIDTELMRVQQRLRAEADRAVQADRAELAAANQQVDDRRRSVRRLQADIAEAGRDIEQIEAQMEALRQEWRRVDQREFSLAQDECCPACGQALPAERLQAARDEALALFNGERAGALEEINAEGMHLRGQVADTRQVQAGRQAAIAKDQDGLVFWESEAARLQARIDEARAAIPDAGQDAAHRRLQTEKVQVEEEIASLGAGSTEALGRVAAALRLCDQETARLEAILGQIDQRERGEKRIEELKASERRLAAEFERLEKEMYLTEEFTRVKVRLLTDRINGRFKLARFKLFDVQINGAVSDCCETLFAGVPWSSLNTGARTNVGIDILNVLADHYGFTAPVWCDNSESVVRILPARGQMIKLTVSGADKTLRVEKSDRVVIAS